MAAALSGKRMRSGKSGSTQERAAEHWLAMAPRLDALVRQYKVPAYIDGDPIRIPYRFVDDARACELVAFLTALFSYGRRDLIIQAVNRILAATDGDPTGFLEQYNPRRDAALFGDFTYRFNTGADVAYLWECLQWAYREYDSLENMFASVLPDIRVEPDRSRALQMAIGGMLDLLLNRDAPASYGLKFLFAHPARGGACKRFNMFLRWMVRQDTDASTRVDFGLWKNAIQPSELLMPLDTHVMNMNRLLGFSSRRDGSWRTAVEITEVFRMLCPDDPIRYDYALFGFSLDRRPLEELLLLTYPHSGH